MAHTPENDGRNGDKSADSEDVSRFFDEDGTVRPEYEQEYISRLFDEDGNLRELPPLEPYEGYDEDIRQAFEEEVSERPDNPPLDDSNPSDHPPRPDA